MKALSLPFLHPLAPYGLLILRLGLGLIMAAHGWQKLTVFGAQGFADNMLTRLGVPAPGFMAWVVIIVELVGGICIMLGLGTRIWALMTAIVMLVVIFMVKDLTILIGEGSYELELAILSGMLALALVGPGKVSADHALGVAYCPIESDNPV
jgi:putative oxidoreductase